MYSSGYSQVSKNSPQAQKRMQYRSKAKSCGYYMRIVFFFSSLIQSLIIVSLVLFLVYGKKQDSASTARVQDLEESFSRLSIENVALRQQRKNLTNLLNITLTEKARNDWDLAKLRHYTNISLLVIQDLDRKLQQCFAESILCKPRSPCNCPQLLTTSGNCNCGLMVEQLRARLQLVDSNFTQTTQKMRMDMEQIAKERDSINLEAIRLRRDKSTLERELQFCRQKYKDDFFEYLRGVSNVSKAFLEKIDSLFPRHLAFQLTCPKQRDHLEQIRTNCTSLSREVEEKLQRYLNIVGDQVSDIQAENNRLKAENWRLTEDYRWCTQNRSALILEHRNSLKHLQQRHDQDKERLLMEKMKLLGDKQVLENNVKYKSKEVEHLTDQIKYLNMTCMSKIPGFGGYAGGTSQAGTSGQAGWNLYGGGGSSSSSSIGGGQLGRTASGGLGSSLGSSGSAFNKLGSTGTGSSGSSFLSPGSSSSLGSTGLGFNKPSSTGTGSSSSSFLSPGSSSSLGSSGSAFNKLGSTGTGSSSSSFLSPGSSSSLGSTGLGFNKPSSTGTGSSSSSFLSPGSSSSLGSTGSGFNKPGSTGGAFSNFGSAGSSPSLSSSGIGSNKPTLNSRGSSTTGSSSVSTGSSPNLSSSGIGSNKPTTSVKSSSSFGSSSGSTGSTTKTGSSSSGFSWFGLGNSNSGQSKTGSGIGKGTSSGNSGTGSVFGSGRTVSVAQHLQDLQRIINPPGPEDKQELSRMLG